MKKRNHSLGLNERWLNNEKAKAGNQKLTAKIKIFTNENKRLKPALKKKVPDYSETSTMPSDSEADVSNEVL